MRLSRRSLSVMAAGTALAAVLVIWMVSLGSGVDGRSERIVEVYARQMDYPADEAWVRQEALEWSAEVCELEEEVDVFVRHVTTPIDSLIELADVACPDRAQELRAWKAAQPGL